MTNDNEGDSSLKHALANMEQQKRALQALLQRASDEIEELAESGCDDVSKEKAVAAAKLFRRAATL